MRIMNISPINQNQTITTCKKKKPKDRTNVNFTSSVRYLSNEYGIDRNKKAKHDNLVEGTLYKIKYHYELPDKGKAQNEKLLDEYLRNFFFNPNVDINAPEYEFFDIKFRDDYSKYPHRSERYMDPVGSPARALIQQELIGGYERYAPAYSDSYVKNVLMNIVENPNFDVNEIFANEGEHSGETIVSETVKKLLFNKDNVAHINKNECNNVAYEFMRRVCSRPDYENASRDLYLLLVADNGMNNSTRQVHSDIVNLLLEHPNFDPNFRFSNYNQHEHRFIPEAGRSKSLLTAMLFRDKMKKDGLINKYLANPKFDLNKNKELFDESDNWYNIAVGKSDYEKLRQLYQEAKATGKPIELPIGDSPYKKGSYPSIDHKIKPFSIYEPITVPKAAPYRPEGIHSLAWLAKPETIIEQLHKNGVPDKSADEIVKMMQSKNSSQIQDAEIIEEIPNTAEKTPEIKSEAKAETKSSMPFDLFKENSTVETSTSKETVSKPKVSSINIPDTEKFDRISCDEIKGFSDVYGLEDIKKSLKTEVISAVLNKDNVQKLANNKTSISNGMMLVAPVGNGKFILTQALSQEANMPMFEVENLDELQPLLNSIETNFKNTQQRAIVFLHGLDNYYAQGADTNGELTNRLNSLLKNTSDRGSYVVLSVENEKNIPKSLLSPRRINKVFRFKAPDMGTRTAFLTDYFSQKPQLSALSNEDIKVIAEKTHGFSISQIKKVVDETVISTIADEKDKAEINDMLERVKVLSKELNIPEINDFNKTSIFDTVIKRYQPKPSDAKDFESIAGMPTTKSHIQEAILEPWKNAAKLRENGIQLPAGAVFAGDPGTSKSYMAQGIARSLDMPLYKLKMSEIGSANLHEVSKKMGDIVTQLIRKYDETGEGSVLLIDEIDYFQKGQNQAMTEEVNTLLQEVERGRNKVLFLGTTNEIESLPDSLIRDGRMGTVVHFEHCNKDAAKEVIKNILKEKESIPEVKTLLGNKELLEKMAARCDGMVAASISEIVNDSLTESLLGKDSIENAMDKAISLRRKKDIEKVLSQNSKNAGHRLNISEDSTLMFDTQFVRTSLDDHPSLSEC